MNAALDLTYVPKFFGGRTILEFEEISNLPWCEETYLCISKCWQQAESEESFVISVLQSDLKDTRFGNTLTAECINKTLESADFFEKGFEGEDGEMLFKIPKTGFYALAGITNLEYSIHEEQDGEDFLSDMDGAMLSIKFSAGKQEAALSTVQVTLTKNTNYGTIVYGWVNAQLSFSQIKQLLQAAQIEESSDSGE